VLCRRLTSLCSPSILPLPACFGLLVYEEKQLSVQPKLGREKIDSYNITVAIAFTPPAFYPTAGPEAVIAGQIYSRAGEFDGNLLAPVPHQHPYHEHPLYPLSLITPKSQSHSPGLHVLKTRGKYCIRGLAL
jgi:hypothetical protein